MSEVLGDDHPDTLAAKIKYAARLLLRKDLPGAARLCEEGLSKMAQLLTMLQYKGGALNDPEIAEKEAHKKMTKMMGNKCSGITKAMLGLSYVLQILDSYLQAQDVEKNMIERSQSFLNEQTRRRKHTFGEKEPESNFAVENYTKLLAMLGSSGEAAASQREVLEKWQLISSKEDPAVIESMGGFADILQAQECPSEAEPVRKEAIEKSKELSDEGGVIENMEYLAAILLQQEKFPDAEEPQREALRKRQLLLNPHATPDASEGLAVILRDQDKLPETERVQKEVLEKRRELSDEDDPEMLSAMDILAEILRRQGKFSEAEGLQREAYEKWKMKDADSENTISSGSRFADIQFGQGNHEALGLRKEVTEKRKRLQDKDDSLLKGGVERSGKEPF
ncbi:conserved hypothetical protein [Talaromyces stipitatus ATCC 10500]|uniref:Tetratricopeptide repeat domain protein n=1 Tax=Talaromyces stipitatus (strain ATCC 10500 / CBS 375.48 / QM 6759 / NRRL 1006) TaxID=441959 RepID=B8MRA8_TALSN|nr:uncharacterized protein TSTA_055090 [Talaromyces stipitatus ATCC 10500]EED13003.1 conserved hypothetical protein [Talaromyces stipitatus ATCC 10500]